MNCGLGMIADLRDLIMVVLGCARRLRLGWISRRVQKRGTGASPFSHGPAFGSTEDSRALSWYGTHTTLVRVPLSANLKREDRTLRFVAL